MTCPHPCPLFSPMRCGSCRDQSQSGSLSTFGMEPQPTTSLTGLPEQGIPSQPPRSSERDAALLALNEAYNHVARMRQGRVASIVKTKIEEAEMWLGKVAP